MTDQNTHIEAALQIIISLGLPRAQHNERSALSLLALLNLTPDKTWREAENPLIGITPIMDWVRTYFRTRLYTGLRWRYWRQMGLFRCTPTGKFGHKHRLPRQDA